MGRSPTCRTWPASMTAMRSPMWLASVRSWVTMSTGEIQVADEAAEFAAEGKGHAFVEGGEGFIQEEGLGATDQGAGQGSALGLAAGDLGGGGGSARSRMPRVCEQTIDPVLAFGAGADRRRRKPRSGPR